MYNNNKAQRNPKGWTEICFKQSKENTMFNKLLIKALKKRFNKLSPDEKQTVREMVNNETISETTEKNKNKVKKRRTKKMADEKEVKKDEVETEKVETENKEVDNEKSTEVAKDDVKEVEKKEEKVDETQKEEPTEKTEPDATEEEPTAPQVNDTEQTGNGVRIEDLVTKDMLAERLAALEAKFDAVVKENTDLKNELSNKSDELNGMKDKYENKDFGGYQKQGVMQKDKYANSSFDEYAKAFM